MVRRTYTPEQIINKLREVEVLISQGATAAEASRQASRNRPITAGVKNMEG